MIKKTLIIVTVIFLLLDCSNIFASENVIIDTNFKKNLLTFISKVNLNKAFTIANKIAKEMKADAVLGRIEIYGRGFKGKGNSIVFQYNSNQIPFYFKLFSKTVANIDIEIDLDNYSIGLKELYYSGINGSIEPLSKKITKISNGIDIINKVLNDSGLSLFINKYKDIVYIIKIDNFRASTAWDINFYTNYYNINSKQNYYLIINDDTGKILTRWCTDSKIRDIVGIK